MGQSPVFVQVQTLGTESLEERLRLTAPPAVQEHRGGMSLNGIVFHHREIGNLEPYRYHQLFACS
ncbi:hypothetical protein IL54_0373 [Sphingobium sp. ba1]|nr:hypothetical protein IL54_0373 [Sphingobium sp. ba1]